MGAERKVDGVQPCARTPSSPLVQHGLPEAALQTVTSWRYMAEGNMNVVFGRAEPWTDGSPLRGLAIRVRKVARIPGGALPDGGDAPGTAPQATKRALQRAAFLFARSVMPQLVGSAFVHAGWPVAVQPAFLQAVAERLAAHPGRPARRRGDAVDVGRAWVTLMRDYTQLHLPMQLPAADAAPTFCVELKPKCGLLPPAPGQDVCRYCMHQLLKARKRQVLATSAYCPLDLYSGCRRRVRRALRALCSNPQNNLRLFKDGHVVDVQSRTAGAASLASAASPAAGPAANPVAFADAVLAPAGGVAAMVRVVGEVLLREPVLRRLQLLQALDHAGVQRLMPRAQRAEAAGRWQDMAALPAAADWLSDVRRALERVTDSQAHPEAAAPSCDADNDDCSCACACCCAAARPADVLQQAGLSHLARARCTAAGAAPQDACVASDVRAVQQFLLAATAKDCSLMLAFRRIPDGDVPALRRALALAGASATLGAALSPTGVPLHAAPSPPRDSACPCGCAAAADCLLAARGCAWWRELAGDAPRHAALVRDGPSGTWFAYSLAVVDLDMKPAAKLAHYAALDAEIARNFAARGGAANSSCSTQTGQAQAGAAAAAGVPPCAAKVAAFDVRADQSSAVRV